MTELIAGKRYKVTFEATAQYRPSGVALVYDNPLGIHAYLDELPTNITVEVVEPPIVTFEPGDRVKSKVNGWEYTVGHNGYYCHDNDHVYQSAFVFTSEHFDKVD